jgi:hypothetical protein
MDNTFGDALHDEICGLAYPEWGYYDEPPVGCIGLGWRDLVITYGLPEDIAKSFVPVDLVQCLFTEHCNALSNTADALFNEHLEAAKKAEQDRVARMVLGRFKRQLQSLCRGLEIDEGEL